MYVTHARTAEELKAEVLSDLTRRLSFLDGQIKVTARGEAEKSRLRCAERELTAMLQFWTELEIVKKR